MENVTSEKRPIATVLRNMKVGEVEAFAIEQYQSLTSSITRLQIRHAAIGIKWSCNRVEMQCLITRIA